MSLRENLSLAFKVSRFRFWFYLTGPFTVGCIYGATRYLDLLNVWFFVYLFYFLLPANVFLYGVNDYWDFETDLLNPKKEEKEYRVKGDEKNKLGGILRFIAGISLVMLLFMGSNGERAIFIVFLFLSYFYSAKPLRFKEKPILDSTSNLLYILPGVLAYYWVTGTLPSTLILVAGVLHSFAMHLFSAIPDIEYDRNTGINTSAVLFGRRTSLIICLVAWTVFASIVIFMGGSSVFRFLPVIYPVMVLNVLFRDLKIEEVYWYYPYINVGFGGFLFLLKAIQTPWS